MEVLPAPYIVNYHRVNFLSRADKEHPLTPPLTFAYKNLVLLQLNILEDLYEEKSTRKT